MMMAEKRNLNPLLLKFGVAFALSLAGFLYSRFRIRKKRPPLSPPSPTSSDQENRVESPQEETHIPKVHSDDSNFGLSPSSRHVGDDNNKDAFLLPEFHELIKEFDFSAPNSGFSPRSDVGTPKAFRTDQKDDYEQEIKHLKAKVKTLRERERNLEIQLLEFYGLKEQETAVMELQNRLKINNMEAKLFSLKIESLQTDNRRLEAQVSDHTKSLAELEAARTRIKLLKKKLRYEAEQNRGQILTLQQRVAKLQDQECKIKDLECEIDELRKSNFRLQVENSDLGRRLEATQVLANSILEDPEAEASKKEQGRLTQENEELVKEIEQLQVHRCADVEELVYLRWVNACLRYELRNFQPPPGKTAARDLSKTLSPKSEQKTKKLILDYANTEGIEGQNINIMDFDSDQGSSSQTSFVTDSGDMDDSSVDLPSTTTTTKSNSSKIKFMSKLRKLLKGKEASHNQVISAEKSGLVEDSDSPRCSSSTSTGTNATRVEGLGVGYATSSQSSMRLSVDLRRLGCQKEEDGKTGDCVGRNSDVGFTEKSELMKYAEVLKGSRRANHKPLVKSASIGF